jgi:malonyl-CoA O-methyltransferase
MAERLPIVKLQPSHLLDWGALLGASHELLATAYPKARQTRVEADIGQRDRNLALLAAQAAKAGPAWSPSALLARWSRAPVAVSLAAELPAGGAELLWANMMLHGAIDPQAVMRQWQRALAVDGFLMFSTLGPGSLDGLRAVYAAAGWPPPHAPFVDMHDLGDMLVAAGFADPVMDQELLTLTWATPEALLAELRGLGGNADPRRAAGLRTPRWRRQLHQGLEALRGPDGRLRLVFEIVYGHAFRPPPRPRLDGVTAVPLDDMRSMVRAGRRRP